MEKKMYVFGLLAIAAALVSGCSQVDDPVIDPVKPKGRVFEVIDLCSPDVALSEEAKSALARVKVSIRYELDVPEDYGGLFDDTRIYVRSVTCSGFALSGALEKGSAASGRPLWRDCDGQDELVFSPLTFNDGRKDGMEGSADGAQGDECGQMLNPALTENHAPAVDGTFGPGKNPGVGSREQPLFMFCQAADAGDGYSYVIPRHQGMGVDIDVTYYVETIDTRSPGFLTDGETHGIVIEDRLSKRDLLGEGADFEPGKSYLISIIVGQEGARCKTAVN